MIFKHLADLCDITIGRTPSRSVPEYWGGSSPWVSISDMRSKYISETKEGITDFGIEKAHCRLIKMGTLLLSFKLSIGKLSFADRDLYTNEAIAALQIKDNENLYSDYLYYALRFIPLTGSNQAAMGKTLNSKSLAILRIPIPKNYNDQVRVAGILSQAEGLIEKRKESIRLLDEFLKSTFLEMFGDPVRNEKGWEEKTSIDYADCIVPGRDKPKGFSGRTPWVTTNDLVHLGFTEKSISNIGLTDDEIKGVRARVIPKDSVLITCVGDLGVISRAAQNMVVNQQLHTFQCNKGFSNVFFMHAISYQKAYMLRKASKTTVPYMNKTVCNSIPMINPPLYLQKQFASIVEKVEAMKTKYQVSLEELEGLYSSLSQRAFKGKLDLSGVELK
ncbi:MAG: restriction endonuclease subunit S [Spirochaetia bacterium]|nr:restriction endonuclease subunit S [Spirochaetia bacterium]